MEQDKPKRKGTRLAMQLPGEINEYFERRAREQLTSKSAIIRVILREYMQSHPENQQA